MGTRKAALWQDTYARLKHAILDHDLKPGDVISISELARLLGVSRTPVKEALSRLERDHLVELIPHQGVKVRELSLDEVIHILSLREALDGLAARLAAGHMDITGLDRFEREFRSLASNRGLDGAKRQATLSRELHEAVIITAGNPYLEATWRSLMTSFARVSSQGWRALQGRPSSQEVQSRRCEEHIEIVRALRDGDEVRAELCARLHVANALRDIMAARSGAQATTVPAGQHRRTTAREGTSRRPRGAAKTRLA